MVPEHKGSMGMSVAPFSLFPPQPTLLNRWERTFQIHNKEVPAGIHTLNSLPLTPTHHPSEKEKDINKRSQHSLGERLIASAG